MSTIRSLDLDQNLLKWFHVFSTETSNLESSKMSTKQTYQWHKDYSLIESRSGDHDRYNLGFRMTIYHGKNLRFRQSESTSSNHDGYPNRRLVNRSVEVSWKSEFIHWKLGSNQGKLLGMGSSLNSNRDSWCTNTVILAITVISYEL